MIKNLRKKFIITNMLMVFFVLTSVFSIFTISSYNHAKGESIKSLQMVLNRRDDIRPPLFEIGKKPPQELMRSPVFLIRIDHDANINFVHGDRISISQEDLNYIGKEVSSLSNESGIIKEYNLRFQKLREGSSLKVAFIEISEEQTVLKNTLILSFLLMTVTMAAFFIISSFLSRWALSSTKNAWDQQKQFISDASHELKTPLTVILANTDILEANPDDRIKEQLKWVKNTKAEAIRMKQLVNHMLFLAKGDAHTVSPLHSTVHLSDIVFSVTLAFESVAYEKRIQINTEKVSKNIFIFGDENQLKQLLSILIDNAIKYSPENSTITAELEKTGSKAELRIKNSGTPLSKEERKHLFERFYRCDESRAEEGYGLGLSIAQSIVHSHKGKIYVQSSESINTFLIILPN